MSDPSFRRLGAESLSYGLAGVIQRFGGFVLAPVLARVFTPDEFGQVTLIAAATGLVGLLAALGLDSAAHRWYWERTEDVERRAVLASWVWCQLVVSTVLAAAIFAAAEPLSTWFFGDAGRSGAIRLAAVAIPLGVIPLVASSALRLRRSPRPMVGLAIVGMTVTVVATLLWMRRDPGPEAVFVGQVAAGLVGTALGVLVLRGSIRPSSVRSVRLREMLRFAVPLIPVPVASWIIAMADRFFIDAVRGVEAVALYQVGAVAAVLVGLATTAFSLAWGPYSLSIHRRPDADARYAAAASRYVVLGSTLALAVSLLAGPLVRLIGGTEYPGAAEIVPWLAFAHLAAGAVVIAATGGVIAKDARPFAAAMGVGAAVTLAANVVLVPTLGPVGAAVATLIAQGAAAAVAFIRSSRRHPVRYPFVAAAAFAGTGLVVAVGGGWLLRSAPLAMVLAVAAITTVVAALAGRWLIRRADRALPAGA